MYKMYSGERNDEGKKHGFGTMTYPSGHRYEGNYINGVVNGEGFARFRNKDEYRGNYVNNKKSGRGVYTWKNGNKYEGMWDYNKSKGPGIMIYADGTKEEGVISRIGMEVGQHIIFTLSTDGISFVRRREGLFKITNKNGIEHYKYFNKIGELDQNKTISYNTSYFGCIK